MSTKKSVKGKEKVVRKRRDPLNPKIVVPFNMRVLDSQLKEKGIPIMEFLSGLEKYVSGVNKKPATLHEAITGHLLSVEFHIEPKHQAARKLSEKLLKDGNKSVVVGVTVSSENKFVATVKDANGRTQPVWIEKTNDGYIHGVGFHTIGKL